MSKFLEGIATILLPSLQQLETTYITELLAKVHERDADKHKALLITGAVWLRELKEEVEKTKTKFDDAAVVGLLNAIDQSASDTGVTLPE